MWAPASAYAQCPFRVRLATRRAEGRCPVSLRKRPRSRPAHRSHKCRFHCCIELGCAWRRSVQGHLQGWMILGFRSSLCFPLTPAGILVVSRPRGVPPLQLKFHGIYEVLLSLFQADTQSRSRAGVNSCTAALKDAGCNGKALRI